jgi:MFS family permease
MTALGGAATSFLWLSFARIGVGVGEATASPCSHALLADIFPAKNRATALAVYLTGTYLGSALAMIIGGLVVQHWDTACDALPFAGACGFAGWQAALIIVGLPGLPLALVLLYIREPERAQPETGSTLKIIMHELTAALPPFTLFSLHKIGGHRELLRNVILAAVIGGVVALLTKLTGDVAQWAAVGLGLYAVVTWGQVQKLRDRPLYALTFGDPTFLISQIGSALLACIGGAVSAWSAPYAMRTLGLSPVEVGLSMGLIFAGSAVCGVLCGGWMADRLKRRDRRAPIFVAMLSVVGEMPFLIGMLMARETPMFLVAFAGFAFFSSLWGGAFAALVQDLVLPRMRGSAASAFSLFSIVVASGIGPYWAGKVSTLTGSLQSGLYSMLLLVPVVLIIFIIVLPKVRIATPESRLARAIAAGEAN